MKSRLVMIVVLGAIVLMLLAVAGPALAGGGTNGVINDAKNGTIDQTWSAAQIRAALAYLRAHPLASQYSDYQGVLEDYLQSMGAPGTVGAGANGAQLAFTGAEIWLVLIAGAGLVGGGLALKRRSRAER